MNPAKALTFLISRLLIIVLMRYFIFILLFSGTLILLGYQNMTIIFIFVFTLLSRIALSGVFYNLNDCISINRFNGTLNMRMDINLKKIRRKSKTLKIGTDKYLTSMFLDGIKNITNTNKLKIPYLIFKKEIKVSTNEAIYKNLSCEMQLFATFLEQKIIYERLFLMSNRSLLEIVFSRQKRKKKLINYLSQKTNSYKFIIPIEKCDLIK